MIHMWIPESETEIVEAVEANNIIETPTFDAEAALPQKGKSRDLATDIAAMANDGGVLLYGVAEDDNGQPTVSSPIDLSGARERVDQIVRTCLSEPPEIAIHAFPTEEDPARGYLAVVVPASPRAPHMVTVGKDYRYYGRSATGNTPLTEGEVARLYERRQRWEVDREALLDEQIGRAPLEPREGFAYLHLVARPAVPEEDLFDKAKGDRQAGQFLNTLFSAASSDEVFPGRFSPDLPERGNFSRRANGWLLSLGLDENRQGSGGSHREHAAARHAMQRIVSCTSVRSFLSLLPCRRLFGLDQHLSHI